MSCHLFSYSSLSSFYLDITPSTHCNIITARSPTTFYPELYVVKFRLKSLRLNSFYEIFFFNTQRFDTGVDFKCLRIHFMRLTYSMRYSTRVLPQIWGKPNYCKSHVLTKSHEITSQACKKRIPLVSKPCAFCRERSVVGSQINLTCAVMINKNM